MAIFVVTLCHFLFSYYNKLEKKFTSGERIISNPLRRFGPKANLKFLNFQKEGSFL